MKKLTIKLKYDEVVALDMWLDLALSQMQTASFAEKCIKALMYEWYLAKVKTKTHFRFPDKISFKLNDSIALAMAHLINNMPNNPSAYFDSKLLLLLGDIDRRFQ